MTFGPAGRRPPAAIPGELGRARALTAPLHIVDLHEADQAAVRDHRALRPTGGAAGEEDQRGIVLVDRVVGQRRRRRMPSERLEVGLELDDGRAEVDVLDAFETAGVAEHDGGLREIGAVADLVGRPPSVERGDDRAEARHRPEQHRLVGAVRREDRDTVALLYAVALTQRRRDRSRSRRLSENVSVCRPT